MLDDKALKRAARLGAAAQAVDKLDLKAIAETYKKNGASDLEAAAVAASALGAAVSSALGGSPASAEDATKVAQQQVVTAAKKKQREQSGHRLMQERVEEAGPMGEANREMQRHQLAARAGKAVTEKEDRLNSDAATRRAMREERASAAASRRCLSEARAFLGLPKKSHPCDWPSAPPPVEGAPAGSPGADFAAQDPVLRRAKGLLSGASQVMASLDAQNEMLRRKAANLGSASSASGPPPSSLINRTPIPRPAISPGAGAAARAANEKAAEDELLAKAKELLADYVPPERKRKPNLPTGSSATNSPKSGDELARAKAKCTEVSLTMQRRRFKI